MDASGEQGPLDATQFAVSLTGRQVLRGGGVVGVGTGGTGGLEQLPELHAACWMLCMRHLLWLGFGFG
jgi:hypothetical protein